MQLSSDKPYSFNEPSPVAWQVERMANKEGRRHFKLAIVAHKDITVNIREPPERGEIEKWVRVPQAAMMVTVPNYECYVTSNIIRCQDINQVPEQGKVANFASTFAVENHVYINKKIDTKDENRISPIAFLLDGEDLSRDSQFAKDYFGLGLLPSTKEHDLVSTKEMVLGPKMFHAIIKPRGDGVDIVLTAGLWQISITNENQNRSPAYYWYQVTRLHDPEDFVVRKERYDAFDQFLVRVVHSKNVKVHG
ncbi:MAG: hypothetical protein O3C57_06565 [Verrucomicrobia bacterium]|nr:hypothetical protein [Verrucomicrobiota bacterium]